MNQKRLTRIMEIYAQVILDYNSEYAREHNYSLRRYTELLHAITQYIYENQH